MKVVVAHKARDIRIESRDITPAAPNELQIQIATGGICGSDLHYYNHGGFGPISLKEPMILGHEVSGVVTALGSDTQGFAVGDLVAVSPSRPCYQCTFCNSGLHNQCLNMRFYGSAMPMPHIQGAFRESINALASQCVVANGLSSAEAAMAEPLAVALHATRRAGDLLGKKVLVTGCGPIGILSILVARRAGAAQIVATDLADNALAMAMQCGADRTINTGQTPAALDEFTADKGHFDVHYECSGALVALAAGIAALKPRGIIVQLGLGGDMSLPMMQITAKELDLRGSFRFHEEFATAVQMMQKGLIDVKPLATHSFALDDMQAAFDMANDRSQAMKVQLTFS